MNCLTLIQKAVNGELLTPDEKNAVGDFIARQNDSAAHADDELTQLKEQLQSSVAERDEARNLLGQMQRRRTVEALAQKHGFSDPGYLEYLLQQQQTNPDDPAACENAVRELRKNHPKLFQLQLAPGGGSCPETATQAVGGWNGDLAALLAQAPEIGH